MSTGICLSWREAGACWVYPLVSWLLVVNVPSVVTMSTKVIHYFVHKGPHPKNPRKQSFTVALGQYLHQLHIMHPLLQLGTF